MNIYEELYKYLKKQVALSNQKLYACNNLISSLNLLKQISGQLNLQKINISNIESLVEKLNIEEKNQISELLKYLENISVVLNQLDSDVNNIDESMLLDIFVFFDISSKRKYIDDVITIKNTNEYISDPNFVDTDLMDAILDLKKEVKVVVSNCYYNIVEQLKHLIINLYKKLGRKSYLTKELTVYINKLEKIYLEKFNFSGPKEAFDSLEQMKEFFDIIEDSTLDKSVILELILEFCKYNVDFHNKRLSIKDTILKTNIEQNTNEVVEQIEILAKDKNNTSQEIVLEVIEKNTNEIKLTEDEEKIYNAIKEIVKIHQNETIEEIFVELFKDDFSLESRKSYYGTESNLNWGIIITDLIKILEPNLKNNKELVFDIFNYILEINDSALKMNNQKQQLIDNLTKLNKEIDQVLEENDSILKKYNNFDISKRNYYDVLYQMIFDGNFEEARNCAEQINETIEYINLLGIILKISNLSLQIKEFLNNNVVSEEIYEEINEEVKKILLDYETAKKDNQNQKQVITLEPT